MLKVIVITILVISFIYRFIFSGKNLNKLICKIESFFRRKRALKFCKNFLLEGKNYYRLQNNFVSITVDRECNTIKCCNRKNDKESIFVDWRLQKEYQQIKYNKCYTNRLNTVFDNIAINFYSATTYTEICNDLILNFETITQTKDESKAPEYEINIGPKVEKENLLNINEATEQEIIDLPGINVAHAKKIIRYRDLHNGFKNLDEFYKEMKIKPHFIKKLNQIICVEECIKEEIHIENNERIIDL